MTFHGTLQERVERDCIPEPMSGCWLWFGPTDAHRYGYFKWKEQTIKAHRASWEVFRGPVGNLCVLHRCDNPPCVNPDHLFLGTRADNNHDRDAKGRKVQLRGEKHGRAKLTEAQAIAIRFSDLPGSELAKLYGVNKTQVSAIRTNRTWKHLNQTGE